MVSYFQIYLEWVIFLDARRTNTKEKIIEYATDIITTQGYKALSIRSITNSLGISSAAFYNHFKNKNELLDYLIQEISSKIYEDYILEKEKLPKTSNSVDELSFYLEYFLRYGQQFPLLNDFLYLSDNALAILAQEKFSSFSNSEHKLLYEGHRVITNLKNTYQLQLSTDKLHAKFWTFFHGYSSLLLTNVYQFNQTLVDDFIVDVIAGDIVKRENISVTSLSNTCPSNFSQKI